MKDHRDIENSNSTEWYNTILVDEKPTRLSGVIFMLLYVMLIFSTIAYGAVETWALGFLSIGACLIALFWLADSFFAQEFRLNTNPLQLPLIGLILIGLIQLLPLRDLHSTNDLLSIPATNSLSVDPNITRLAIIQLLIYLIFLAAGLVCLNSQKRLRKMVFTIIIFGAFWSFFGILQWLSQIGSIELYIYGFRPVNNALPFASFVNKHHFAAFMEMTIGLTLGLLYGESTERDKRLLFVIAIVLMGSGLILTGSRGGILSLLGVIGFVTLFNLISKKKNSKPSSEKAQGSNTRKFILVGASLALILVLLGSVVFLGGDSALMRGAGLSNEAEISNGRFHFWQTALQIIKDNPIIGTGLDSFGVSFTKYDSWNGNMRVEQAHNEYLQILADAGILGLACVIAFIFMLFRQGFRLVNQTGDRFRCGVVIGSMAGCFGILIHSFFDFPLRTPSNSFFFLMLAVLATGSISYPKFYRK